MLIRNTIRLKLFQFLLVFSLCLPVTTVNAQEDFEMMTEMVELMDGFMDLMDSVYKMNANSEKAVLLQMHALEEIYKQQGKPGDAIKMYRRVLDSSANPTVRNMAYQRMADVMKESGDLDAAVEVLNTAMTETLRRTK